MKTYLLIAFICCAIALVITYLLGEPVRPLPAPPKAPEPPPDLPISCFVKGLIVSLEKEPLEWAYYGATRELDLAVNGYYSHVFTKDEVTVELTWHTVDIAGYRDYAVLITIPETGLNRTERRDLTAALIKAYDVQNAKKLAVKEAEAAKKRAPFEALGCPDEPRTQ